VSVISAPFQAHLDGGTTTLSWAWRVTRTDGVVMGFTDHDTALTFDGTTFEAETGLVASEIRASSDMAVDAQDAEGMLTSGRITETDIADGLWDNAAVEVFRVNWADTSQRSLRRRGTLGEIRRGRLAFVAEMRSLAHILSQTVGRTFQSACDAALGDARCGIDLESATFKGSGAVTALTDGRSFTASGLSGYDDQWFSYGKVTWVTGANAGRTTEVAVHRLIGGVVTFVLMDQAVRPITVGDSFAARAGCNKSVAMCFAKFDNVPNFRGFPTIPGNDAVLRYAASSNVNDGSVL
jgi:uncharacterized phage protein (TIGR02218 family)